MDLLSLGLIEIAAEIVDGQLAVHVRDTGIGFLPKGEGGVGLANVRGRLKEAWPELLIVGEASNGREAIDLVRSRSPDIVFLDISMPGTDGIEAAQAFAGQVHVVFVTAHDENAIRAEDKCTRVQTPRFEALIRKPIKELIDEPDPNEFWQLHHSTVVRVDAVEQVGRNLRGIQVVHVKGSDEKLEVSRSFNHLFRQLSRRSTGQYSRW